MDLVIKKIVGWLDSQQTHDFSIESYVKALIETQISPDRNVFWSESLRLVSCARFFIRICN